MNFRRDIHESRLTVATLAVPLLLAAGACASGDPAPAPPPPPPPSPALPTNPPTTAAELAVPETSYDIVQVCDPGTAFPDSAPYAGAGPHPIALFLPDSSGRIKYQYGGAVDPADYQLAGCITPEPEPDGFPCGVYQVTKDLGYIDQTTYESLSIHRIRYEIEVYEVTTARLVDTISVVGTRELECPESIFPLPRSDRYVTGVLGLEIDFSTMTLTTDPTRDEVLAELEDLVSGPV